MTDVSSIFFRVYDVLYALDSLSKSHERNFLGIECGLVDLAVQVTAEWQPGKYASMFSNAKASTYPVLELSTDILKHLAQSAECKARMHHLRLESTLDRLLHTEEGAVRAHVLKVLWVLRDHLRVVESAIGIVAHVEILQSVSQLYTLTRESGDKLAVRLKKEVHASALDNKVSASIDWLQQSIFADATSGTLSYVQAELHQALASNQKLQEELKKAESVKRAESAALAAFVRGGVQKAEYQQLAAQQLAAAAAAAAAAATAREAEYDEHVDFLQARLQAALAKQIAMASSAISVEKLMDNLRMITLNLDRDFDAWTPEDSQSLADTVAESAGVAKEHVKILDCQRGSVIASTVILAPDWVAVAEKLRTSLTDESGSLKDIGVVGCTGMTSGVVGKPPCTMADVAAPVVPARSRVMLGASAPGGAARGSVAPAGLVEKNTRFVERVVARWTRRDVSAAFECWFAYALEQKKLELVCTRIVEKMLRHSLDVAMMTWKDHVRKQQRIKYVCSRIVLRLVHRDLSMAFELWLCHVKEQQRMELVCTRIVKTMLHHSLEVGMMTWKDHARKQQRATTVCARVVSRWLHRCIANAFESWHLHAKEQRRMEDLCCKIVRCGFQKFFKAFLW